MKTIISLVTAGTLMLAFGLAYAADDQMPELNAASRETGIVLYETFLKDDAGIGMGWAAGGVRIEPVSRLDEYTNDEIPVLGKGPKDLGVELQDAFLKHEADIAKGTAAGGVRVREARWPDDVYSYGIAK